MTILQAKMLTPIISSGLETTIPMAIKIGPMISMITNKLYQLFFTMIRPSIPIKIGTIAEEKRK